MQKESDIIFESGSYFVIIEGKRVSVNKNVSTHSIVDSQYENTEDGNSLAICRCKYLSKKESK